MEKRARQDVAHTHYYNHISDQYSAAVTRCIINLDGEKSESQDNGILPHFLAYIAFIYSDIHWEIAAEEDLTTRQHVLTSKSML